MTDLLTASSRRTASPGAAAEHVRRPLWLGAAIGGTLAALGVLAGCMGLGLVGWFASDAGAHGDTRDAIRVGADAWLLAHGAPLHLAAATISLVPLGLTLLCGYVTFRLGRWAALTSSAEDTGSVSAVGLSTVVFAGLYAVVAVVTAVLASTESAETSLGRAFAGGFLLAVLAGGAGLVSTSEAGVVLRDRVPVTVRAAVRGGLAVTLLVVAAGAVLGVAALLADFGTAANVLSRLHPDAAGAALYTVVVAGVAPNVALFGSSYLLGPGFAVGTGTAVSPAAVVLGPVPAFPVLAALPAPGPAPSWAIALVALPVLLAGLAGVLVVRHHPALQLGTGALRGAAAGVLGGVMVTLLSHLAGGSVGPGRMADVGVPFAETLVAATVALGVGGLVGGVTAAWWLRRRAPESDPSTEDTVIL